MPEINRIAEIFKDRNVFITGGTGFLGKVLVEKLLRCTQVKTVYLLVRNKKGKNSQDRLDDIFKNMVRKWWKNSGKFRVFTKRNGRLTTGKLYIFNNSKITVFLFKIT